MKDPFPSPRRMIGDIHIFVSGACERYQCPRCAWWNDFGKRCQQCDAADPVPAARAAEAKA